MSAIDWLKVYICVRRLQFQMENEIIILNANITPFSFVQSFRWLRRDLVANATMASPRMQFTVNANTKKDILPLLFVHKFSNGFWWCCLRSHRLSCFTDVGTQHSEHCNWQSRIRGIVCCRCRLHHKKKKKQHRVQWQPNRFICCLHFSRGRKLVPLINTAENECKTFPLCKFNRSARHRDFESISFISFVPLSFNKIMLIFV